MTDELGSADSRFEKGDLDELANKLAEIARAGGSKEKSGSLLRDWLDITLKTVIAALAALGTYYVATRKEVSEETRAIQSQTNADVRFLMDLVHGGEADRAIAFALANAYSGDRVPRPVAEAIQGYIVTVSTRSQAAVNNEVALAVPPSLQADKPAQAVVGSLPIRVYFQYKDPQDRARIDILAQSLNGLTVDGKRVLVPPAENVSSAPAAGAILKCFRRVECGEIGNDLVAQMKLVGAPSELKLVPIPGYENSTTIRSLHYEAWFGPLTR